MRTLLLASASLAVLLAAPTLTEAASPVATVTAANPLLQPWTGPYGGFPAFDKVKVADFKPALEEAMTEQLAEVDRIADNPAPPTFRNTIEPMERAGRKLNRVQAIYGVYGSSLNLGEFPAVQKEMAPKLSAFYDRIIQNKKLFARIETVYEHRATSGLTPEQQRLSWFYWNRHSRAGAKLNETDKARVSEINQGLAKLSTQFSQNLLADEAGYVLYLKEADLEGLPQGLKDAAAEAGKTHGHPGEWAITNTRSSMDPFLTYSARRDLREKVWRTYYSRGDNHDAHDNSTIIAQILKLRAEKAKLLGYTTFAHWKLADTMAKTPDNAMDLMMKVWPSAVARVHQEVADMQAVANAEGAKLTISPWDYRYYAEKVRKAKYALDMNEVKPYLQMDKLREGMFWAANQLYGFTFTRVEGVPVFNPDMTTYEVKNRAGKHVGLWYFDPYSREGKNSGAWMAAYRSQQTLDGAIPTIVSNNANFVKPAPGQPVLISWDDAVTMFHEFGHALHGLNSDVVYPTLASPNTARDFVEFPSQLNENWLPTREVLSKFAVNAKGEPIPPALVEKIKKASTFNQGFAVTEYLSSAIIDMKLHLAGDTPIDADTFEKTELAKLNMPSELPMRHRTPQFQHIFAGDGYSAGYYGYLWAEVLDHDAFEAFNEAGGPYDKPMAKKLHDTIMAVGNTVDPAVAYRNFRGRDPDVNAYLRSKGFPTEAAGAAKTAK